MQYRVNIIGSGLESVIDGKREAVEFLTIITLSADSEAFAIIKSFAIVLERMEARDHVEAVSDNFSLETDSIAIVTAFEAEALSDLGFIFWRKKRWWEFWK